MSDEIQLPTLTTQETQRLRSDYPSIEHLEAGNVAAWLVERQEQLLVRAKDERTGMNLAKLLTLAVAACKHNRSGLQTRRELAQIICN